MEKDNIHILLIEDNSGDARLIREFLNEEKNFSFELVWATRLHEGLEIIAHREFDAVILDLGLPDSQGFETFTRAIKTNPKLPIIVLTGLKDEELAIKALRNGAQDYLVKGQLDGNLIVRALRYSIERKRIEEKLRYSEKKYRNLYESSKDGIVFADIQGNILDANSAFLEMLQYKREEIRKINFQQLTPKKWQEKKENIVKNQLLKRGYSDEYEKEYIKKNGATFPAIVRLWLNKDEQGKTMGVWAIVRDITERKKAEEILQRSEEKFKTLAEKSPSMIFINKKRKIVYANQMCEEILGYTKEEFYSSDFEFLKLIVPEQRDKMISNLQNRVENEDISPYAYTLITKEGRRIETIITMKLISYDGDKATLAIITDITEQKRAEKELRESYKKLRKTLDDTVKALASAVEMRDPYTAGHQQRVARLACAIAEEMGLPEDKINGIRMAGAIHDIGKISIPAEILSKPTQLNEGELSIIQKHSQVGYDILKEIKFPWPVPEIVLQHHERMLGDGYPQGLSGEDILMEARILAVADVVEAMYSHRPHRPALGIEKALQEIRQNRGFLYDPIVVDTCLKLFLEKGFKFEQGEKPEVVD